LAAANPSAAHVALRVALSAGKCDVTIFFKERLQAAIKHVGTAAELARRSGVPAKTISNYLNDVTEDPKGEVIAKLAAGAGVRVEWLFAGKPPMLDEDEVVCWRRLNIDPPCRLNIDPGPVATF